MEYASLTGFVRTLLIIIAVLLAMRVITRMLLPYLLRHLARKAENHINSQMESMRRQQESTTQAPPQNVTSTNKKEKVGEYIDFEEID